MARICPKLEVPPTFSMEERLFHPTPLPDVAARLEWLEQAVRDDLEVLKYPSTPLPYRRRTDALEVAIIGGGQNGKAVAFGLRRYGVHDVKIFDRNAKGLQGPWRTYGRNHVLRTDKDLVADSIGASQIFTSNAGPTPISAQTTIRASEKFRGCCGRTISIGTATCWSCRSNTRSMSTMCSGSRRATALSCKPRPVRSTRNSSSSVPGSKVPGRGAVPPLVQDNLPPDVYAHTMSDVPFDKVVGRNVVVIGAAPAHSIPPTSRSKLAPAASI